MKIGLGNKIELSKWKKIAFLFPLILLLCLLVYWFVRPSDLSSHPVEKNKSITPAKMYLDVCVDSLTVSHSKFKRNQTLSDIILPYVSAQDVYKLSVLDKSQFNVKEIKAGNKFTLITSRDSIPTLNYFIYSKSLSEFVVCSFIDSVKLYTFKKDVVTKTKQFNTVINSSLYEAIYDVGVSAELSWLLSDIYQWTIDFHDIKKGDSVSVLYNEQFVDSVSLGISNIVASKFVHEKHPYYAIGYNDGGTVGFWDDNGNNLRKSFLKTPLKFSRISSKFTNARRHPILKIVRPHHGVDYAAPLGTPVWAVADGVVIKRSYDKGAGNMLKIRHRNHNGKYVTGYLHLRSFARGIKIGGKVNQGQVIGYVGSTGLSTGPHLDYRIWKNGKPINPLNITQEKGVPISKKVKSEFILYKDSVINLVNTRL